MMTAVEPVGTSGAPAQQHPQIVHHRLEAAGVRLTRSGDDLHYETRSGVTLAPYRERILANKPALCRVLGPQGANLAGGLCRAHPLTTARRAKDECQNHSDAHADHSAHCS